MNEVIDTLRTAAEEIRSLRRRLEVAEAKAMVADAFAHALAYQPPQQGHGEDIAWRIEEALAEVRAQPVQPPRDTVAQEAYQACAQADRDAIETAVAAMRAGRTAEGGFQRYAGYEDLKVVRGGALD